MNIIKNIETVEQLNELLYTPFILGRNDLLKFNAVISYVYNNGLYKELRDSIKTNIFLSIPEADLSSEDVINTFNNYADRYLFPFNKKVFYKTFLADIVPSLADSIYKILIETHRIMPIGTGLHKAFIVSPHAFESLPIIEHITIDNTSLSSILTSTAASLDLYMTNVVFYEEKIIQRDNLIKQLSLELEESRQQVYFVYQTTWR